MFAEMKRFHIKPGMLVHALQNHDELTYELVHLVSLEAARMHGDADAISYLESSTAIRADMRRQALGRAGETEDELKKRAPNDFYNKESTNGLCTTMASLIAAKLGARTLTEAARMVEPILKGHMLLAAFNALQPGVFALSGWDLVGALPVPEYDLPQVLTNAGDSPREWCDKDYRWINRGAYRLMSTFGTAPAEGGYGVFALPEAQALYGPLDLQMKETGSFFHQLRRLLQVREQLEIPTAEFAGTLTHPNPSVLGFRMWTHTSISRRAVVTLFNFAAPGAEPVPCDLKILLEEQWPKLNWPANDVHVLQHCPDGTVGWEIHNSEEPMLLEAWEWKLVRFTPITTE